MDTLPFVSTLCSLSPLNLRLTCPALCPRPRELTPENEKRRVDLLPLINPPPLVPLCGVSSCARHLGGCLLARAPDLLV